MGAANTAGGINDTGAGSVTALLGGVPAASDYTGETVAVQAAREADAQNALTAALNKANANVVAAETAIADVDGLAEAIAALESAESELATASDDLLAKAGVEAGAVSYYDAKNSSTITPDATTGAVLGILAVDGTTGRVKLDTGITEATNPGVTALLNAVNDRLAAKEVEDAKTTNVADAVVALNKLDPNSATVTELAAVGTAMKATTPDDASAPTEAEIAAEVAALTAGIEALATAIGDIEWTTNDATTKALIDPILDAAKTAGFILAADETAIATAFKGEITADNATLLPAAIKAAIDKLVDDADAPDIAAGANTLNPATAGSFAEALADLEAAYADTATKGALTQDLLDAKADVEAVQGFITALNEAITNYEAAKADVTTLDDYNTEIAGVEAAIADAGYKLVKSGLAASVDNDVFFLSNLADGNTITSFGKDVKDGGADYLVSGEYTNLVKLDVESVGATTKFNGVADKLEVFAVETSTGVDLYFENQAAAGNLTYDATNFTKITLNGVTSDDLGFDGGMIFASLA
ncbi:MAG: hypothetical protein WCR69_09285 [Sulfuricurvum sp.]